MKKSWIMALLGIATAAFFLCFHPFGTVEAEAAGHEVASHCICGGSVNTGDHTKHTTIVENWIPVSSDAEFRPYFASSTGSPIYIYVEDDFTIESTIWKTGSDDIYLCLNGKTITSSPSSSGFRFETSGSTPYIGGYFYISDCSAEKTGTIQGNSATITTAGAIMRIHSGSKLYLYSGTISGGTCSSEYHGGNLYIATNAEVYIYEGKIKDGVATSTKTTTQGGGNIVMNAASAKLVMYGGEISGGKSYQGGNICVQNGTFEMSGGEISGGTATSTSNSQGGGNIYLNTSSTKFVMSGGEISGGTARSGGSIFINNGTFEMQGGEISGGTATTTSSSYGGGNVCLYGASAKFNMTDGVIKEGESSGVGGNVRVHEKAEFNMSGGVLYGGTSTSNGKEISIAGKAVLSGEAVIQNLITGNFAIAVLGTGDLKVSGNVSVSRPSNNNNIIQATGASSKITIDGGLFYGNVSVYAASDPKYVKINGGHFFGNVLTGQTVAYYTVNGGFFYNEPKLATGSDSDHLVYGNSLYTENGSPILSQSRTTTYRKYDPTTKEIVTATATTRYFVTSHSHEPAIHISESYGAYLSDADQTTFGWAPWGDIATEQMTLPNTVGNYYLVSDITLESQLTNNITSGATRICLNGHTVTKSSSVTSYSIGGSGASADAHITFTDCAETPGTYRAAGGGSENVERLFRLSLGRTLNVFRIRLDSGALSEKEEDDLTNYGGVAYVMRASTMNLFDVHVTGSRAAVAGGAIYVQTSDTGDSAGSNLRIFNSTIEGGATNSRASDSFDSFYGGNIYIGADAVAFIKDSVVKGGSVQMNYSTSTKKETAFAYGGNIFNLGDLTIEDSEILGGTVEAENNNAYGGNVYVGSTGVLTVRGSNTLLGSNGSQAPTAKDGGNLYSGPGSNVTIEGGILENGRANRGGNIYINANNGVSGTVTLTGTATVRNGQTTGTANSSVGGNIASRGFLNITGEDVTVSGGQAVNGGSIAIMLGEATISAGAITGGVATKNGGNVYIDNADLTLGTAAVTNGTANRGGNIYLNVEATFNATGSTVNGGNAVEGSSSARGANIFIYQNSKVTLKACTVKAPQSTDTGAANVYVNITPTASFGSSGEAARTKLTIEDGTVISNDGADLAAIYINGSRSAGYNGVVSMSGGKLLAGEGTAIQNYGTLEISGGYIEGAVSSSTLAPDEDRKEEWSASISGGYFTEKPAESEDRDQLAPGYVFKKVNVSEDTVTYSYTPAETAVYFWSMVLNADLSLNFYALVNTRDYENAALQISLFEETETFSLSDAVLMESGDYEGAYKFTYRGVTADLFTSEIEVELLNGEDSIQETPTTLTVQTYLNTVINAYGLEKEPGVMAEGLTDVKKALYALIRNLFIYGREAQNYFGTNTDNLVVQSDYESSEGAIDSYTIDVNPLAGSTVKNGTGEVSVASATILHRNENRIRFMVAVKDGFAVRDIVLSTGDGDSVEYTVDPVADETLAQTYAAFGTLYYLTLDALAPTEYDTEIILTADSEAGREAEYHYSVDQYSYNIANSAKKTKTEKDFAKALYLYGVSADAYVAAYVAAGQN